MKRYTYRTVCAGEHENVGRYNACVFRCVHRCHGSRAHQRLDGDDRCLVAMTVERIVLVPLFCADTEQTPAVLDMRRTWARHPSDMFIAAFATLAADRTGQKGCPLSMMFIVALCLPWCRYLSAQVGVQPQLYADLKCVSRDPDLLLSAARFTTGYVRLVGQEPAPSKCVFLITARDVRKDVREWVLSLDGDGLSGLMFVIWEGIWIQPFVAGRLLWLLEFVWSFLDWFSSLLFLWIFHRRRVVRSMYLPAALHGIAASLLASDNLRKLRSSIHRVVWSRR